MPPVSRVVFLGNDAWSVPSLARVVNATDLEVVSVVTNPPRPAGRGSRIRPTAVADAAAELGAPLLEVDSVRDARTMDRLRALAPDLFLVVAYGELLPVNVLSIPKLGSVNLHFSLLPRWRGASPVQHALLHGDRLTGVTVMLMDQGLDTGPVLAQIEEPVDASDDAGSLGGRLAEIGAELLVESVRAWVAGRLVPEPQRGTPTYAPKLTPLDRMLDWMAPAPEVMNRIRALAPDPGARTTWRGAAMNVLRAESGEDVAGPPGEIVATDADGVLVKTGSGVVRLLEVAPAGRRRMPAADWARGARPSPGDRLG
jgi:methionyl-tRNA formyltransferase